MDEPTNSPPATDPVLSENQGVPGVEAPLPTTSTGKKKLWRTLISVVVTVLALLALREFIIKDGQWQSWLPLPEHQQQPQSEVSELEKQVARSKEHQDTLAQLTTSCQAKNLPDNCVVFSLNQKTLECESKPRVPCCGNGICELSEQGICTADCQSWVGQNSWDSLIAARYDTDENQRTMLVQTFTIPSGPVRLSAVSIGVELASGLDDLRISIIDSEDLTAEPVWEFLVPLSEISPKQMLRVPVLNQVSLDAEIIYSLVLMVADDKGSVNFRTSAVDHYPAGSLQSVTESLDGMAQRRTQTGDLQFQIEFAKPVSDLQVESSDSSMLLQ